MDFNFWNLTSSGDVVYKAIKLENISNFIASQSIYT